MFDIWNCLFSCKVCILVLNLISRLLMQHFLFCSFVSSICCSSADMLVNLGINWVILGHSERRALLNETNDVCCFTNHHGLSYCHMLTCFPRYNVLVLLSKVSLFDFYSCVSTSSLLQTRYHMHFPRAWKWLLASVRLWSSVKRGVQWKWLRLKLKTLLVNVQLRVSNNLHLCSIIRN